jgi:hypothetical protein
MRMVLAAALALAMSTASLGAQSLHPPASPFAPAGETRVAPLPAVLRPRAATASPSVLREDALRPRLRNHLLWGAGIGAATGAVLGAVGAGYGCVGSIDDECGSGAELRGALIFGALGAGLGAAVYAIRR